MDLNKHLFNKIVVYLFYLNRTIYYCSFSKQCKIDILGETNVGLFIGLNLDGTCVYLLTYSMRNENKLSVN